MINLDSLLTHAGAVTVLLHEVDHPCEPVQMNCYDDDWLVEHLTPRPDFIFFGRMLIFSNKKSEFELNGTSTRCCIFLLNCLDVYVSSIIIHVLVIFYHRPL